MKNLEKKIKNRSCMCSRFLGIGPQTMYESGEKIKTFLDGGWNKRGSRKECALQAIVTGLGRRRIERNLQE